MPSFPRATGLARHTTAAALAAAALLTAAPGPPPGAAASAAGATHHAAPTAAVLGGPGPATASGAVGASGGGAGRGTAPGAAAVAPGAVAVPGRAASPPAVGTPCAAAPPGGAVVPGGPSYRQPALDALGEVVRGDFAAVSARFAPALRRQASAQVLERSWQAYVREFGRCLSHGEPRQTGSAAGTVVGVPLRMEKGPGEFRVTYDGNGLLVGLYFLRAGVPVP